MAKRQLEKWLSKFLSSGHGPNRIRTRRPDRTHWLLLCFIPCVILYPRAGLSDDAAPCDFSPLEAAETSYSNWHDFFHSADVHREEDERARKLDVEVQKGANCLLKQAQSISKAATDYRQIRDTDRVALKTQLNGIETAIQKVSGQVVDLPSKIHSGGMTPEIATTLSAMAIQLTLYNQQLAAIETVLKGDGSLTAAGLPPINITTLSYSSAALPTPKADSTPRTQFDPRMNVLENFRYSHTHVEFALAAIPDPRVPRHRRQYDNTITALNQAMLREGFVLDSYSFPWSKDLQPAAAAPVSLTNGAPKDDAGAGKPAGEHLDVVDDDRFGLMLFRGDLWRASPPPEQVRKQSAPEVQVRAVYLIPENGTYGLQRAALRSALLRIDHQVSLALPGAVKDESDEQAVKHCNSEKAIYAPTLFGPTFSGSLDSIRETVLELSEGQSSAMKLCHLHLLRLVAATTTVDSNDQVDRRGQVSKILPLQYIPLARTDREKLDYLGKLSTDLGVPEHKVAIVYESTTFGMEACKIAGAATDSRPSLCDGAMKLPIPVNIADVRFGLRAKLAAHARELNSKIPLPMDTTHLSLEDGAENGSEFPESQQSPLTAASTALELQRLIDALRDRGAQLVVIIATDVRDRLFLMEQIGAQLNGPLFVDLGADRLLGHPDFIHATRGALTLSSSWLTARDLKITGCEKDNSCPVNQVWSTDEEATQAAAVRYWAKNPALPPGAGAAAPNPIPYVVSRSGLVSEEDLFADPFLGDLEIASSVVLGIVFAIFGVVCVCQSQGQALYDWSATFKIPIFLRLIAGLAGSWLVWLITKSFVLAALCGIAGLYLFAFQTLGALYWSSAVVAIGGLGLLVAVVLQFGTFIRFSVSSAENIHPLLIALSQAPTGGMAYPLAQCVAVIATIISMLIGKRILTLTLENDSALLTALTPGELASLRRPTHTAALLVALIALATACIAPVVFVNARQVTVFGWWADLTAFASLSGTTLLAFSLLIGAVVAVARIDRLCDLVATHLREIHGWTGATNGTGQALLWSGLSGPWPDFLPTPVLAGTGSGGTEIRLTRENLGSWKQSLDSALHVPPVTAEGLRALYALLASEMATYQWCIAGVAILAVLGSLMVFLFPVSEATALMVLNLVALVLAGAYAAYQTVSFEGNTILSNVLCNRPQTREWSLALFAGVAVPFVALAIVISIGQVPGVLDVGTGVLSALLKWLKVGGG